MKVVAFERNLTGTSASRRLRHDKKVPGIVYGGGVAPKMIELDHNALDRKSTRLNSSHVSQSRMPSSA